jgi:hypothetical protein
VSTSVVAELVTNLNFGMVVAVVFVAGLCAVAIHSWRAGVFLLLGYVTIEGLVSAMLYPSTLPLLFKDALLIAVYLGATRTVIGHWRDGTVFPRSVVLPMATLTAVSVLELANPHGDGILVGFVGLRVTLLCMPLFFIGTLLATERPDALRRLSYFTLLMSAPVTAFGIVEYVIGSDEVKSFGAGFAKSLYVVGPESTFDLIYRPAGTFSSTAGFGTFLLFISVLCLAALVAPASARLRVASVAVLCLTFVGLVLQSQRANWVLLPFMAVALVVLSGRFLPLLRGAPVLIVAIALAAVVGGGVLRNRLPHLFSGVSVYEQRVENQEINPLRNTVNSSTALIGRGPGTAVGAARYVNGGHVPTTFESGWNIPLVMYGIAGVLALLWLYFAVIRLLWSSARRARKRADPFPVAILVYFTVSAAVQGLVLYPPQNVYFWLFAGLAAANVRARARADI